ncbi:MAG: recombinase family protein [Beijerinckiaceae bacterium]|nr:recombinase family protein [Beijerinckiaceae bacterium]
MRQWSTDFHATADGQTTENQLRHLHEVALRSGWTVVAIHNDEGISGSKGRDHRPGLDALLKGVAAPSSISYTRALARCRRSLCQNSSTFFATQPSSTSSK